MTESKLQPQQKEDVEAIVRGFVEKVNPAKLPNLLRDSQSTLKRLVASLADETLPSGGLEIAKAFISELSNRDISKGLSVADYWRFSALEYLVDPWDVIPDFIPGQGFLDDLYAFEFTARKIKEIEATVLEEVEVFPEGEEETWENEEYLYNIICPPNSHKEIRTKQLFYELSLFPFNAKTKMGKPCRDPWGYENPDEYILVRGEFARRNLRLAMNYARKRTRGHSIKLEDLTHEGYLGLLIAIDRFDFSEGAKFSTYAVFWVKQSIGRAIQATGSLVRIPCYLQENREDFDNAKLEISSYSILTLEEQEELLGEGEETSPEIEYINNEIYGVLDEMFDELFDDRQKKIVRDRLGIGDGEQKTLAEIGDELGLSRERIRQIETDCLQKLRKKLEVYLGLRKAKDQVRGKKAKKLAKR